MSSKKSTTDKLGQVIKMPTRFKTPQWGNSLLLLLATIFMVWSVQKTGFSVVGLIEGIPDMFRILGEMLPPDLNRLGSMSWALLETFQMALVGASLGIVGSFFLSLGAARNLFGKSPIYFISRGIISFFRTVPDLVWAIFFVASVGLGSFAGILTIMVDTMGFCGRFFAEAMEEVDPEPTMALKALGARKIAVIFTSVVPAALPSFINTALFSLEKAVRASVVLGLVGAGGIGIELKVSMDMFQYKEAATVILLIFLLVLLVERLSALARRRVL